MHQSWFNIGFDIEKIHVSLDLNKVQSLAVQTGENTDWK